MPRRHGLVGFGMAALVGIASVGRFFGGLSSPAALLLGVAPVLTAVAGMIGERSRATPAGRVMRSAAYRLALAGVVLASVLVDGYREFDRSFRPLLAAPRAAGVPPAGLGRAPALAHDPSLPVDVAGEMEIAVGRRARALRAVAEVAVGVGEVRRPALDAHMPRALVAARP